MTILVFTVNGKLAIPNQGLNLPWTKSPRQNPGRNSDGSGHALMTGTPTPRSTHSRETAIAALRVSVGVTVFST